jgi:DNA-binding CsgD family transcriptional regulator
MEELLAAAGKRAGIALIEGATGTGKTRLLAEGAALAEANGFALIRCGIAEFGDVVPLLPLLTALDHAALCTGPACTDLDAAEQPWVDDLVRRLRDPTGGVVLTVDDLHLADADTASRLRGTAARLPARRLAWLLARRTDEDNPEVEELFETLAANGARRIRLGPLSEDATAALLGDLLGATPEPDLMSLAAGAGGNPLLVTHLALGLRDYAAVDIVGDRARLTSSDLPDRLRQVAARQQPDEMGQASVDGVGATERELDARPDGPTDGNPPATPQPATPFWDWPQLPGYDWSPPEGAGPRSADTAPTEPDDADPDQPGPARDDRDGDEEDADEEDEEFDELTDEESGIHLPRRDRSAARAESRADRRPEQSAEAGSLFAKRLPAAMAANIRSRLHLAAGRVDEAEAEALLGVADAEQMERELQLPLALSTLATVALRRGDLTRSAEYIERCRLHLGDVGETAELRVLWLEGQLAAAQANAGWAMDQLRRLYDDPGALRLLLSQEPVAAGWLVRNGLAAGDDRRARGVASCAELLSDGYKDNLELQAAGAHAGGLLTESATELRNAAQIYRDPWARASAWEDLGALIAGLGDRADRDEAISNMNEALAAYEATGALRDVARVRGRLRRLGIRRRHWNRTNGPTSGWASLTGTEQAVADLVAAGLTNRQVAARMFLSPHTVAFHLRHIFQKLEVSSRVELALRLAQHAQHG